MKSLFTIIKSDYLQRTRSYAFLITLCASLAIGYTFVPEPNASYSTIRISDYVGYYNSAWFGYVTAIMTSIFLSLIGFYLINSAIKTDVETKVGQIVAATSISNFWYLSAKVLSNFLVLLTIMGVVFLMGIVLFFSYNDGFPFELLKFLKPYILITVPALFFVSVLAVVFEVLFGKYSVIQNVGFFFLFTCLLVIPPKNEAQFSLDVFGNKIVIDHLEETVREITKTDKNGEMNIGYVIGNVKNTKKFEFDGVDFPTSFIISRFVWVVLGVSIIAIISPLFHRFNLKERSTTVRRKKDVEIIKDPSEIDLSGLQTPTKNYGIFPLLKIELLLLFRKGKKWFWIINLIGMTLLLILPIAIAHQMVLPILWFLQVSRISDLTTRELTHNVHYFAFTSYGPITRLLLSQVLTAIALMLLLACPLIVRLGLHFNFVAVLSVIFGSAFIVLLAAVLGILSKGKKLFEVLFFMVTYANINGIPFFDYFGGFEHRQSYLLQLSALVVLFASIILFVRRSQLQK